MDPNPGLNTPPRDDHMGRRLYRYGDFNQAIEFHKQAASLSAQEPSELTAVDELKINLLRKAGKAYELSERSETKLAAGRYDKAADSYSSKVPSTVTLESSTFHYLDAVSRIGDLYSFEARGNVIAFRDKGIDFDIEGLPWSVEVLFSRALEYNEDLVQRLTRDGSADSRLIQAAKAYYDLIKAGYEREEAITIFNLAGKARKAEVDWQNSGCVIM